MRISDVFLAFPGMVFAIAVAGVLSGGLTNAVIALACISWPKFARLARSQVLTVKEMPYIAAAKLAGCFSGKILMISKKRSQKSSNTQKHRELQLTVFLGTAGQSG